MNGHFDIAAKLVDHGADMETPNKVTLKGAFKREGVRGK